MTTLWMFFDTPIGLAFAATPAAFVAGWTAEAILSLAARLRSRRRRAEHPKTTGEAVGSAVEQIRQAA